MKTDRVSYKIACTVEEHFLDVNENMGSWQSTSASSPSSKNALSSTTSSLPKKRPHRTAQMGISGLFSLATSSTTKDITVIKAQDVYKYLQLLEQPDIFFFLSHDVCKVLADTYLLAMTFVLINRAGYQLKHVNAEIFYASLFLAHDMEEDLDHKLGMLPYALGYHWRDRYPKLVKKKEEIWKLLNFRALVSHKCCTEVISLFPDHWAWKRERPKHHSEATRIVPTISFAIKKPDSLPEPCQTCKTLRTIKSTFSISNVQVRQQDLKNVEDILKQVTPALNVVLPKSMTPSVSVERVPLALLSFTDRKIIEEYRKTKAKDNGPTGIANMFSNSTALQTITNLESSAIYNLRSSTEKNNEQRVKRPSRLSTFFEESPNLKKTK